MLDDFQQAAPSATDSAAASATDAAATSSTSSSAPAAATESAEAAADEDPLSDEFVEELTKNMESFMAQLGKHMAAAQDPAVPPSEAQGRGDKEDAASAPIAEDELMKQFEKMLSGNLESMDKDMPAPTVPDGGEKSFQDAVKATMEKLKQSNESATKNAKGAGSGNPLASLGLDGDSDLAQVLEALSSAGGDGEMPELNKMLAQMMEDLMNKEILYEPLKDLHGRFPAYLASPEAEKLDAETRKQYGEQQATMGEILAVFESPTYSDSDAEARKKITDLVTHLQDLGTPPQELLGDMPSELAGLNNMLGDMGDENCTVM